MSIETEFCGVKLNNPSVLASGILGVTIASLKMVYKKGAGIVTSKSISIKSRKGHKGPIIFDYGYGIINSVGLSNPGVESFKKELKKNNIDFPLIISIFGEKIEDYGILASELKGLNYSFIEINVSCPNVEDEFGRPFSYSKDATFRITRLVKENTDKPVIVKLSPNTPNLVDIGRSAEKGGADAVNLINTLGPGIVINVNTGLPVLSAGRGGLSGPAILPITVRAVYDIYENTNLPVIGTGGIVDTESALQVIMAGATLYGLGSAVYYRGVGVFNEINEGLLEFLKRNNIGDIKEVIGLSHNIGKRRYFIFNESHQSRKRFTLLERVTQKWKFKVFSLFNLKDYKSVSIRRLSFEVKPDIDPIPGQFYMLWLPGIDYKPFSISFKSGKRLEFLIAKRGKFTNEIFNIKEGYPVGLLGPLGKGFNLSRDNYILVGGGIGIAPLIFSAHRLIEMSKNVTLLIGAKDRYNLEWIIEEIKEKDINDKIEVYCTTEDGSSGEKGVITDLLERLLKEKSYDFALVCGPENFILKAVDIFGENGIDGEASIERMMKCGVGICGSCSIDPAGKRVCTDGPVFSFKDISGFSELGKYKRDESGLIEEIR